MFERILIANRGEIAVRIVRACRRLGLHSIAVFSDADRSAPHVACADEAINIGSPEASASYLNAPKLIAVAQETGAAAVHPGYGFLAENADFARLCVDAGLVFVGPSATNIARMGSKIEAKRLAAASGLACVPGYHDDDQSDERLMHEAERIGAPLLIKASAGGGGRGMRRVDDLAGLHDALKLARQEAASAFGDPTVLLEKSIPASRHVEVQILADKHGKVVHLFERDCSIQRNYQKLIEEAPASNLSATVRECLLNGAVKLAEAIAYDNVGTVEFMVDAATEEAFLLEMNTRLQVEHPVTEMVTGVDLVEWQLRVAAGERLPFAQEDIRCKGYAIEARVVAEDPAQDYRPQTGRISHYAEPRTSGLRIDSGIGPGSEVSHYYDSMLAKVIAMGPERESAIRNLKRGLADFQIGGVGVNTTFLCDVLETEQFQSATHQTNTLDVLFPDGWRPPEITSMQIAQAALAKHLHGERSIRIAAKSPWYGLGAWRISEPAGRYGSASYYLRHSGDDIGVVRVYGRTGRYRVEYGEESILSVEYAHLGDGEMVYEQEGWRRRAGVFFTGLQVVLQAGSGLTTVDVLTAEEVLLGESRDDGQRGNLVCPPMPGLITEVLVTVGQAVSVGDPVVTMEAMKLMHQLSAPMAGTVQAIHYKAGDTVGGGVCIVTIEPHEERNT